MSIKTIKILISVVLLLAALAWLFVAGGPQFSISDLANLPLGAVALCVAALFVSNFLAIARLKWVAGALGYRIAWGDSAAALSVGALGGAVFFQIAGQLIGRNMILARVHISPGTVVLITGIERALALLVSFTLAFAGAWELYGRVLSIDPNAGGNVLMRTTAGLLFVLTVVGVVCWRHTIVAAYRQCTAKMMIGMAIALVLSIAIQLATMAAYLAIALPFVSAGSLAPLLAATTVIMFLASVPISFAGWGVRELSAVAAFGSIGMASHSAFMVAATVGVLSIVTMLFIAAASSRLLSPGKDAAGAPGETPLNSLALEKALAPLAAVLVFFSVYVPVSSGYANITLSDPFAIIGGGLFVLYYWSRRELPAWGPWRLNTLIAAVSGMVLLSYLIGAARFGFTAWASTKVTGWFVLLAYFATGALAARLIGIRKIDEILWPYVVTAAAIIVFDQLVAALSTFMPVSYIAIDTVGYSGFSNNRNAFAFTALFAVGAALTIKRPGTLVAASLAIAGVLLSGSRAGAICLPAVIIVTTLMGHSSWRNTTIATLSGIAVYFFAGTVIPAIFGVQAFSVKLDTGFSGQEHYETILEGLEMFMSFPIFGAGLGAFLTMPSQATPPVIIHSTPVWLLAEMGLAGVSVFAATFISAGIYLFNNRRQVFGCVGLIVLLVVAVFGQAHEILYQRPIWLILGLVLYAHADRQRTGASTLT